MPVFKIILRWNTLVHAVMCPLIVRYCNTSPSEIVLRMTLPHLDLSSISVKLTELQPFSRSIGCSSHLEWDSLWTLITKVSMKFVHGIFCWQTDTLSDTGKNVTVYLYCSPAAIICNSACTLKHSGFILIYLTEEFSVWHVRKLKTALFD